MIEIRPLECDDLDDADEILQAAFGHPGSRKKDLCRYVDLQPDGWFLATLNGSKAGTVGAVDYGPFAYIGMMAVQPQYQHRGIGRALLAHMLEWLDARGSSMALLDANNSGYPLYLEAGFAVADEVRLFQRVQEIPVPALSERVRPMTREDLPSVIAFDQAIFGAARPQVLHTYLIDFPQRAYVITKGDGQIDGYIFAQELRLGPWVAGSLAGAQALLDAVLALSLDGQPTVIIPTMNEPGAELLVRAGFVLQRTLRHMRRGGQELPSRRDQIYGQASFAIG